jgi:hypothetical protein
MDNGLQLRHYRELSVTTTTIDRRSYTNRGEYQKKKRNMIIEKNGVEVDVTNLA